MRECRIHVCIYMCNLEALVILGSTSQREKKEK